MEVMYSLKYKREVFFIHQPEGMWGNGSIAVQILKLSSRWRCMV